MGKELLIKVLGGKILKPMKFATKSIDEICAESSKMKTKTTIFRERKHKVVEDTFRDNELWRKGDSMLSEPYYDLDDVALEIRNSRTDEAMSRFIDMDIVGYNKKGSCIMPTLKPGEMTFDKYNLFQMSREESNTRLIDLKKQYNKVTDTYNTLMSDRDITVSQYKDAPPRLMQLGDKVLKTISDRIDEISRKKDLLRDEIKSLEDYLNKANNINNYDDYLGSLI